MLRWSRKYGCLASHPNSTANSQYALTRNKLHVTQEYPQRQDKLIIPHGSQPQSMALIRPDLYTRDRVLLRSVKFNLKINLNVKAFSSNVRFIVQRLNKQMDY
jgi:hypothetical protein